MLLRSSPVIPCQHAFFILFLFQAIPCDGFSSYVPIPHCKVRLLQITTNQSLTLFNFRSYAEPLWKGCRDDRFSFSRFTSSIQYLACRFICRNHHCRVSFPPMNTAASVEICKQDFFSYFLIPCHFDRVCITPVGHRLPQHRTRSSSNGV